MATLMIVKVNFQVISCIEGSRFACCIKYNVLLGQCSGVIGCYWLVIETTDGVWTFSTVIKSNEYGQVTRSISEMILFHVLTVP